MNVQSLTRDHDIIFCLLDEMSRYVATENPQVGTMKERCADLLLDYCSDHFCQEEAEMRHHDYPYRKAHELEHKKVQEALRAVMYGMKFNDLLSLIDFLRQVIIRHIITWDEAFILWEKKQSDGFTEALHPTNRLPELYASLQLSLEEWSFLTQPECTDGTQP